MHPIAFVPPRRARQGRPSPARLAGLAAALAVVLSCSAADAVLGPGPVPAGPWGGPQGNLVVYPDSVTMDLACAAARIPAPLTTDADGHFDVNGFWAVQAGPIGIGGANWQSARFTGQREGNLLQVNVQVNGGGTIGPLDFKRGVVGTFPRCL